MEFEYQDLDITIERLMQARIPLPCGIPKKQMSSSGPENDYLEDSLLDTCRDVYIIYVSDICKD